MYRSWKHFQYHIWQHLSKHSGSVLYKNEGIIWCWRKIWFIASCSLLCNHEKMRQNVRWLHWMHSAVIFQDAFLFKTFYESRTTSDNNDCVVAEESSNFCWRIAWQLCTVYSNLSKVTFRDTFELNISPVSDDTFFSIKMGPPLYI